MRSITHSTQRSYTKNRVTDHKTKVEVPSGQKPIITVAEPITYRVSLKTQRVNLEVQGNSVTDFSRLLNTACMPVITGPKLKHALKNPPSTA